MTGYSLDEITALAERTAAWRGWDLLLLENRRAPRPWRLLDVVAELLTGSESVLDVGCGDGRLLAALAGSFKRGIGVDVSKARVDRARLSLPMKLRMRVHFTRASAHAVPAPDGTFHLILNRHAPIFPAEVERLLAPGGCFVTQQVGPESTRAILAAFREACRPLPPSPADMLLPAAWQQFLSRGYSVIRHEEYDVPYVFGDAASLLYWMQHVPVPPDFEITRDAGVVLDILDRLGTPGGIVTNEHRQLLVVQKPG